MVSKTIYSIKWYQISIPIKYEICMMILRSQKPCYITAGKIYVMHLENFNAVLFSKYLFSDLIYIYILIVNA